MAAELKVGLYRVDLSAVVSRYIGETEKNLRTVFARAEDKSWVLFFDEADALFGQRPNVEDSHDRYPNPKTNHLLRRIEAYRGVTILSTTTAAEPIDDELRRRLRYVVQLFTR